MAKTGPQTEPHLEDLNPRTLYLDDLTIEMAKVLGLGNQSRGVRQAIRFAFSAYQSDRFIPGTPTSEPFSPQSGPAVAQNGAVLERQSSN